MAEIRKGRQLTINKTKNARGDVVTASGRVLIVQAGFRPRVDNVARPRKKNATTTALRHSGGQGSQTE